MTTVFKFEGYSDDLVHVAVDGVWEEYCGGENQTFAIYPKNVEREYLQPLFYVNAYYGVNGATWSFAIEQVDEDIYLPVLIVQVDSRRNVSPYSTTLTVTLTGEVNAYVVPIK